MVSRTKIPASMYPDDYTPSTPSGTVTPASMTKDGSGKPLHEEMYPDYPCGDEPGHYFINSPVNVSAIDRDDSVVLYVEGGCPNFTWESDNEWATFETAETAVRYNTLASEDSEGEDTVVTVTDTNSAEVTISVPYKGAPDRAGWHSIFDNTCWEITGVNFGSWETDKWEADKVPGYTEWRLRLYDIGSWSTELRPTKLRVTFTGMSKLDVYLDTTESAYPNSLVQRSCALGTGAESLEELDIDATKWNDNDIHRLYFNTGSCDSIQVFYITNIEFWY